jgi:hypothetical protein
MGAFLEAPYLAMIIAGELFLYFVLFAQVSLKAKAIVAGLFIASYVWEAAQAGSVKALCVVAECDPLFMVGRMVFGAILVVATWLANASADY